MSGTRSCSQCSPASEVFLVSLVAPSHDIQEAGELARTLSLVLDEMVETGLGGPLLLS